MITTLFDIQDTKSALNGLVLESDARLTSVLDVLRNMSPRFIELVGENGYHLMIGIGGPNGCVQFSRTDGDLPYLMALGPDSVETDGHLEFLAGGTLTPISMRYILSFETTKQIAIDFLNTGNRSPRVQWKEI